MSGIRHLTSNTSANTFVIYMTYRFVLFQNSGVLSMFPYPPLNNQQNQAVPIQARDKDTINAPITFSVASSTSIVRIFSSVNTSYCQNLNIIYCTFLKTQCILQVRSISTFLPQQGGL